MLKSVISFFFIDLKGYSLFFLLFEKKVGNKNITVTCKMKQPYCVDLMYNVKFITNKLSLLNELNNIINEKFKSKYNYISVNGYYMPIYLEDIDDESEYDIDERKIFIQNLRKLQGSYPLYCCSFQSVYLHLL